ncbi:MULTISPECIES: imidazolonepropionase [Pseudomonas syringae group genomosp. 2]|uniref:Imidazolonepropionase n=7 Tax=Pseudomonas syringae group genomosp. 2 TaxID=251698 RepID=A0A3M5FSZ4_PSESS|nr:MULTISPECIES: imidazolonepropionase [Pseudomonas syringae group genomosp. 2]ARD14334.1 imidazolonepropionase [Pseudomonas savastanoi pv. savastanoi NCPPB 3335]KPW72458.1 Imidazolonepropionase [Pseudomonas amygdali pv. ciccaronei]KPX81563.1 Imidazolonepropionase [Pseudomonas amygdali pv. photiniae]KPX86151.1 Imidazolonepropionase [Pseudomonas meliae]KPX98072.1 Imidazolonepropionase [Pseudomonas savastanoi pv. nerii]
MKTLWKHCHIASMAHGKYSIIENAAIVTSGALIEWIGPETELAEPEHDNCIDLGGAWVTPGLIDCHTHTVFGGNRSGEFEQRLQGVSYAEIAAAGGGIASTVRATRAASEDELYASAERRLRHLLKDGVTTVEMKSGYGLDLENERKILRVIRRLGNTQPVTVRATCLAAHALPPEYADRADDYINHICNDMLPTLAAEGLVDAVDAFCEYLAFSPAQVEQVFISAGQLALPVKLHAEQLSSLGGSSLAARYKALSADHLEFMTEDDAVAMAAAGTVAVLLPGAFYFLRETQLPPMEALRKHGVPIAISTDLNPGTSPGLSLRLMLNMACTLFRMTPEEALAGVTFNAAKALGMSATHGSLEVGKVADFVAWDIERPADLAYWLGGDLDKRIVRHGVESSI